MCKYKPSPPLPCPFIYLIRRQIRALLPGDGIVPAHHAGPLRKQLARLRLLQPPAEVRVPLRRHVQGRGVVLRVSAGGGGRGHGRGERQCGGGAAAHYCLLACLLRCLSLRWGGKGGTTAARGWLFWFDLVMGVGGQSVSRSVSRWALCFAVNVCPCPMQIVIRAPSRRLLRLWAGLASGLDRCDAIRSVGLSIDTPLPGLSQGKARSQ